MKKSFKYIIFAVIFTLSLSLFPIAFSESEPTACNHNEGTTRTVWLSPTCQEEGFASVYCSKCGEFLREESIPRSPHNYVVGAGAESASPTCTSGGTLLYTCSVCGISKQETYGPLGHDYYNKITEPTCTEDGEKLWICNRCHSETVEVIPALGHDFELVEDSKPSCTETGIKKEICKNCEFNKIEKREPLGHNYVYTETDPTCTEAGEKHGICSRCKDETDEEIPALGHEIGEWYVVEKATLFKEGLEQHECSRDDFSETRPLPKLITEKIVAIAVGGLAVAGTGIAAAVHFIGKGAAAATAAGGMITLQMKRILLCLEESEENKAFEKYLRKKVFLDCKKPGEKFKRKKETPNLILSSAHSLSQLEAKIADYSSKYPDIPVAVISDGISAEDLKELKDNKKLFSYAAFDQSDDRKLLRLIMPLYAPKQASGNYAENLTLLTDALGLGALSTILNLYVVGGDVKEAVENKGLASADLADMVNDLAGLFGLDALSNISEAIRVGLDQKHRVSDKHELEKEDKA